MHPDPAALARSSGAAPSGYPLLSFGAAGGAWGLAAGELVSVTAQAVSVLVLRRRAGGLVVDVGRDGA